MKTRPGAIIVGLFLVSSAAVGGWAGLGGPGFTSIRAQILAVSGMVLALVIVGIRRSKRNLGRVDPFHPLVFPLIYVAVSFLAPLWVSFVSEDPVRALSRQTIISPNTVPLVGLGVAGFMAGCWVTFARKTSVSAGRENFANRLLHIGRLILLIPLAIGLRNLLLGGVLSRGLEQTEYSTTDALNALLGVASVASVLIILAAHSMKGKVLLGGLDWALVIALIVVIGARGSRSDAIAVMIALTIASVWRRGRLPGLVVGSLIMMIFMVGVLQYRNSSLGQTTTESPVQSLLGDMSIAAWTTGATAAGVPAELEFQHGGTLVSAVVRQLPSPIAVPLLGPPTDTAPALFRRLVNYQNPDGGLGFSIPAEGYMNFGAIGVFALCALAGLFGSWSYSRFSFRSGRATGLLYPLFVAGLPFGMRADSLGFIKNLLYPMIIISLAFVLARTVGKLRSGSPDRSAQPRAIYRSKAEVTL